MASEAWRARRTCLASLGEGALAHMDKFSRDNFSRPGPVRRGPARPSRFLELSFSQAKRPSKKNYQRWKTAYPIEFVYQNLELLSSQLSEI